MSCRTCEARGWQHADIGYGGEKLSGRIFMPLDPHAISGFAAAAARCHTRWRHLLCTPDPLAEGDSDTMQRDSALDTRWFPSFLNLACRFHHLDLLQE